MTDGKRRAILIGGALAAVAIIVAGVFVLWPSSSDGQTAASTGPAVPKIDNGPSTSQVIDTFLQALTDGNAARAATFTDDPTAAQDAITALYKGVPVGTLTYVRSASADPEPGAASVTVPVRATLKVTSANSWAVSVQMVKANGKWTVRWAPTVIHAKLQTGQTLALLGKSGESGQPAVVDEKGETIAKWEGSTATPTDPKISPQLMTVLIGAASGAPTDSKYLAILDSAGKEVGETLFGTRPSDTATGPVQSTLNAKISIAAQNAVAKSSQPTMLVAIKPSTGGILAVAKNDAVGAADSPFSGLYAPGSAFKIVSAAAAIQRQGLNPESPVDCPGTVNISGRTLKNADFALGSTKLRTAFAKSCNTTFATIASELPADGLRAAADQFGLNADFDIPGVKSELGKVDNADSPVQRAEDSIGQGKIVASPLGMAVVAATVSSQKAITPKLRKDAETRVLTGYKPPPAAVLGQIKSMMSDVVTSGTATALKGLKGTHGKTGTAETVSQGDDANGWFVGFCNDDVAFAVLVVDGKTSAQAVAVTKAFLGGF